MLLMVLLPGCPGSRLMLRAAWERGGGRATACASPRAAMSCPFDRWGPQRAMPRRRRVGLGGRALLGWSKERPPSRRDAEGDVPGQPRHALASAHGAVRVAEHFECQAETGQPRAPPPRTIRRTTPAADTYHSHQRASNQQPHQPHRKIKTQTAWASTRPPTARSSTRKENGASTRCSSCTPSRRRPTTPSPSKNRATSMASNSI